MVTKILKIAVLTVLAFFLIGAGPKPVIKTMGQLQVEVMKMDIVQRTYLRGDRLWAWVDKDKDGTCDRAHFIDDSGRRDEDGGVIINFSAPIPCAVADSMSQMGT